MIVDDEPLARRGLRRLLESESDFVVGWEATNGKAAVSAIARHLPDVVFLDIQMPVLDGLSMLEQVDPKFFPEIVFVTAYNEHAVSAFDAGAIDYILKPINPERLKRTLDRVRRKLLTGDGSTVERKISDLLAVFPRSGGQYLERIAVHHDERIRFLNVGQIDWICSLGNYIEIHSRDNKFLLRETMSGIESKLDPQAFVRIRRSTIVRIERIEELQTLFGGEFAVVLKDGTEFTSSRRYRKHIESLVKI